MKRSNAHVAKPLLILLLSQAIPAILLTAGCGSPGAPAPPSLNLPSPVQDLAAVRTANSVRLAWTMPTHTTDHVPLKHSVSAEICRKLQDGACAPVATLHLTPGKPADYVDTLPAALIQGPNRLLVYQVRLLNRAGKSAGVSNSAFTAAGAAPMELTGLTAEVQRNGVLLSWHPATQPSNEAKESIVFRIDRVLQSAPRVAKTEQAPPAGPVDQTLALHPPDGLDPGHALDTNAQLNQKYRYTVERVAGISISGHKFELLGQRSDAVTITTTDVFPPAVPHDLVAIADGAGGAIDLSWAPNLDSDLAGYIIYRRDLGTTLPPQRISPPGVSVPSPAYHDTGVLGGHTYAYSVSAIDRNGNESARSREVVETFPN